ncbi:S8 family serine peptidase [Roseateles sp. GG27B]
MGNSTHNRIFIADVALGSGTTLTGASNNANTSSKLLIMAKDAGLVGAVANDLRRCYGDADGASALLDPAKVAGKILVCDRGGNVLVNKSANGKTAGALGVIIANTTSPASANTIINQPHSVSTIHVKAADGDAIKAYMVANLGTAAAALGNTRGIVDPTVIAPVMNSSSSRGPNVANANILKPDFTAPGTDVLATVSPNLNQAARDAIAAGGSTNTQAWALYTGTSMATPHVAGLAALLKQQHPSWTPAMIKSALMTTAYDTFSDSLAGTALPWDTSAKAAGKLPWGQGAGHVNPNKAADPGLVYDAGEYDYAQFLCGINAGVYTAATCQAIGPIAPQNLNLPSLTAANVLGSQTLTRTVTNVSSSASTYNATAAVAGFDVLVTPASFTIAPGATQTFTVKLSRTTTPVDTWAYGALSLTDGTHTVRSPLTARGSNLAVPSLVYSEATSGSKVFTIGTGFAGALGSVKGGLKAATQVSANIGQVASTASADVLAGCRAGNVAGMNTHLINVPAGNMLTRIALFDDDTGNRQGLSDLDLLVFSTDAAQTLIGNSGGATSNEMVDLPGLAAGTYKACVVGYAPESASVAYKISSWLIGSGEVANGFKALLPANVYLGGTASVGMSWSGLAAGKRHLGALSYLIGGVSAGMTVLEVNTNDPLPLAAGSRPLAPIVD